MSIGLRPFDSVLVDFEHFNHSWIRYQRNANANCVSAPGILSAKNALAKAEREYSFIPGRNLLSLRNSQGLSIR